MDQGFDPDKFIARIGQRLVENFDDARAGTTPVTVGDAMEQPVRDQLEQILPRGIAVGEGFIIDSEGGTSKQTDVILYERDICPKFSINDTPGTTFYPCEGVIAVGEVKSTLDRRTLRDAFEKIASVKKLQRRAIHDFMPHPTSGKPIVQRRNYGSLQTSPIVDITERPDLDGTSQIFGFVVAGELEVKAETFCDAFKHFSRETGDQFSPNMITILGGGLLTWGNLAKVKQQETRWSDQHKSYGVSETTGNEVGWEISWSAQGSALFRYSAEREAFRALVRWIRELYRSGKTSDARAFDHYFQHKDNLIATDHMYVPKYDITLEDLLQRVRAGQ